MTIQFNKGPVGTSATIDGKPVAVIREYMGAFLVSIPSKRMPDGSVKPGFFPGDGREDGSHVFPTIAAAKAKIEAHFN